MRLGEEDRFRLFVGPRGDGVALPGEGAGAEAASDVQAAAGDLELVMTFNDPRGRVPEGLRLNLRQRTWDELDGWEKAGVIMVHASAVAVGVVGLALEALD